MLNHGIGIDRPSRSNLVSSYRQRADLRLAGLPQKLHYRSAANYVNFAGQKQQSAVADTKETRRISDHSGRAGVAQMMLIRP
jgi:hypothetical protein